MINENIIIIILGIVAAIIIILLLVIIMMLNKKESSKSSKRYATTSSSMYVKMPDTLKISVPSNIEKMSKREVLNITKKVFDSYKIFDYKKMNTFELDKKEWHSWQISFLLMLYKHEEEFFIPNQNEVFHFFLLNSSDNDIKSLVRGIFKKYENYVDITESKDFLCKNYIWSNKDISILFYFLANYKNY
ncbi:hypothetical protein CP965_12685 [Halarcobacter mediterraneus]|uniref:Uncharacterized protein n=1 Tax=Halarcobacter mediterraneus TaxID=2023153 RepID=A0A4Q1ASN4_9BACT|nr:hypothetical protein [Halarcobacter mediterraneus]RXK11621.1 hypothetical protein CP965_12685 [Halarcobacter mediterraneus]